MKPPLIAEWNALTTYRFKKLRNSSTAKYYYRCVWVAYRLNSPGNGDSNTLVWCLNIDQGEFDSNGTVSVEVK
eukprot:1322850-Amorphochlora_amoeboformis.AAC.1